jgi:hypothetical protein
MRKAILKDGHHVIDGNDDLNDLGFIHGDADQFDFQEFDQHSQGDHHPVIEHPHIDYTILDLYDNNGHWGWPSASTTSARLRRSLMYSTRTAT